MTPSGFLSVQPELAANKPKFLWRDEPPVGNTHSVERPIEIGRPIVQEIDELRKFRRHVIVLPDVALQQLRVVRQAIEDFCRREGESLKLAQESGLRHSDPALVMCCSES